MEGGWNVYLYTTVHCLVFYTDNKWQILDYKKFVIIHCTVILNPLLLKILNNCLFIFSELGPDMFLKQLQPSSLYKPIFCLPNSLVRRSRRYKLTNSGLPFFTHTLFLSKSKDLRAWCIWVSLMVVTD